MNTLPPIPHDTPDLKGLIRAVNDRLRRLTNQLQAALATPTVTQVPPAVSGGGGGGTPPPAPLGRFVINSIAYQYSDTTARTVTLYVSVTPPSPIGAIQGGHVYIEFPDQSAPGVVAFTANVTLPGGGRPTGAWAPKDLGKFPWVPTQQPWQVTFSSPNLSLIGTARVYVQAYSATQDATLVRANQPSPTPNATVTLTPFTAPKINSGVNVTSFLVTNITPLNDLNYVNGVAATVEIAGLLRTPIAVTVDLSGLPNPVPDNWDYQLMGFINGDITTAPVLSSGMFNFPLPTPSGSYGAGPDGITLYHTFGQPTPTGQQTVVIYAVSGLFIAPTRNVAGRLVPVGPPQWYANNIVSGITPSCTISWGGPGGVIDLSQGIFATQGLGISSVNGQLQIATDNTQNMLADGNFSLAPLGVLSSSSLSQWKPWNYNNSAGTVTIFTNDGSLTNPQWCRIAGNQEGIYQSANAGDIHQKTFTVTPGDWYYGSCYFRSANVTPVGGQFHYMIFGMAFYNTANQYIGNALFVSNATATGYIASWTFGDGQIQVPATASYCSVVIQVAPNEPGGGYWDVQTVFMDRIYPASQVQQGPGLVPNGSGPNKTLAVKGFDGFNNLNVGNAGTSSATKIIVLDHTGNPIGWIGDDFGSSGDAGGWFKSLWVGGSSPATAALLVDSTGKMSINMTSTNGNTTPVQINLASETYSIDSTSGNLVVATSYNGGTTRQATMATASTGPSFQVNYGGAISTFSQSSTGGQLQVVGTGSVIQFTFTNQYRALAYQGTATQNLTSGVSAALTFDTNLYNVGAVHSTSTNPTRFTAGVTGNYLAVAQVSVASTVAGKIILAVFVNGSVTLPTLQTETSQATGLNFNVQVSGPVQLNANDYVEFFVTEAVANTTTQLNTTWGSLTLLFQP
jgi:hypothetical protein